MGFLLLGIDSFIACMAIGAIVDKRWRLPLAALFGLADGAAFLIGAGLGWTISESVTEFLAVGTLAALAYYLIVVAAGSRLVKASWAVWVLPVALTMDNLAYGVASDYSGSLVGHGAEHRSLASPEHHLGPERRGEPPGGEEEVSGGVDRRHGPGWGNAAS